MRRILLDECVPRLLARSLQELGVDCEPFPEAWKQVSDSALLERTQTEGFALLLTCDKDLPWQQTLSNKPFGLIVLQPTTGQN
ncbi:DUF5615 family PIN-like protein [Fulvimarina uroteuthidis]|uniref:DUF5615 family PIN-like protein n=1 Tax=Fulvimarina uroteuthidis TaxID=3098149 RepID=UPI003A0FC2AA